MFLSVVIPASNEEQRIGKTLRTIHGYLQQPYAAEIIVVDDRAQNSTASIAPACDGWCTPVSVRQNGRNRGKGCG